MIWSRSPSKTGKREWAVEITVLSNSLKGAWMSSTSMRGAATITSPAVMSAMRITPSSMARDSALMMALSSASDKDLISSSLESGPGLRNSTSRLKKPRWSTCRSRRCGDLLGEGSATKVHGS